MQTVLGGFTTQKLELLDNMVNTTAVCYHLKLQKCKTLQICNIQYKFSFQQFLILSGVKLGVHHDCSPNDTDLYHTVLFQKIYINR